MFEATSSKMSPSVIERVMGLSLNFLSRDNYEYQNQSAQLMFFIHV